GYRLEILADVDREAINEGLTSVNNDACFPSILVVGQLMAALRSGRYDLARNPGFRVSWRLLTRGLMAVIYGDLLMRMLYRVRPYETVPGAAQRLCDEWTARCRAAIARPGLRRYRRTIQDMVRDFDSLPQKGARKPRVGVVGEILVKFHPTANNEIVE